MDNPFVDTLLLVGIFVLCGSVAGVLRYVKDLKVKEALMELHEMAAQFRTDSGSSLRDVVNNLTRAAETSRIAAEDMKINVRTLKSLADQGQVELENLLKMAEASKAQDKKVAANLAEAQETDGE